GGKLGPAPRPQLAPRPRIPYPTAHAPFESAESAGSRRPAGPRRGSGALRTAGAARCRRREHRMDAEQTFPAAVPDEPVRSGPTGRYTETALLGGILVVGLTLAGYLLLAL